MKTNINTTTSERNSNFEQLRILAMTGIIMQHVVAHNTVDYATVYRSFFISGLIIQYCMLGRLGVSIFIILFGYFNIKQKVNLKRIINLILQTVFYSVTTFVIICSIDQNHFNLKDCIKAFAPISFHKYWFISAYIIFYFFTPFLNQYYNSISKRSLAYLMMVQLFLWCIVPTTSMNFVNNYVNELVQFLMIYTLGAYLRLYGKEVNSKKYILFLWGGGSNLFAISVNV